MNIVWIEDFGKQPDPTKLFDSIFKPLQNGARTLSDWLSEKGDLEISRKAVAKYFEELIPAHELVLVTNVNSYELYCKEVNLVKECDLFIIDINLAEDGAPLEIPKEMRKTIAIDGETDFHKRAGLYIYNHLLSLGFPKHQICIMTGEDATANEFNKLCADSLVLPPTVFHKSEYSYNGFPLLHEWIQKADSDKYLLFRRGALNGIKWATGHVQNLDENQTIGFRKYLFEGDKDPFNSQMALGYLNLLEVILTPVSMNNDQAKSTLKVFLRTLVHEWESKANPEWGFDDCAKSIARILKNVRNWLAHGRLLDEMIERDLVVLFIFNFRTMFRTEKFSKIQIYERNLLRAFDARGFYNRNSWASEVNIVEKNLLKRLEHESKNGRYVSILNFRKTLAHMVKEYGGRPTFIEALNMLALSKPKSVNIKPINLPFCQLLICAFWIQILKDLPDNGFSNLKVPNEWLFEFHEKTFLTYFA